MTQHIALESLNAPTSRRQFMVGAAGLTFAFALGGTEHAQAATPSLAEHAGLKQRLDDAALRSWHRRRANPSLAASSD